MDSPQDMEGLSTEYADMDPSRILLRLVLRGVLPKEELKQVSAGIRELEKRFFYLETDRSSLKQKITRETVDREFPAGSFPHLLLSRLIDENEEKALQSAYDLLQEVKE